MAFSIQMVDLISQYQNIREEVDAAIQEVVSSGAYINGPAVGAFAQDLGEYTGAGHVIPCANGTDALQIALMALDLRPGDEVIIPSFTYVATAEVIALLGLTPVLVDVDPHTFNISPGAIEEVVRDKTKAIVPVHLFGQAADMESILAIAQQHGLYVIEDNAQAIGASYILSDGSRKMTGTIGHIGTTSFFPSKNLGCFGDGGAIFTHDKALAEKMRMIANHGQSVRYYHDLVGVNSRLDTLQAAVLRVKLRYLDKYIANRGAAAAYYDSALQDVEEIILPVRSQHSTHVFHQYTMKVDAPIRDQLRKFLQLKGVPSMVYYPVPVHRQKAYERYVTPSVDLTISETLSGKVLSLPMHSELDEDQLEYICATVKDYFAKGTP